MKKIEYLETDIGANKISVKQNSSGFWYCGELYINCVSIIDGIALMNRAIDEIQKILDKKNIENKEKKW